MTNQQLRDALRLLELKGVVRPSDHQVVESVDEFEVIGCKFTYPELKVLRENK